MLVLLAILFAALASPTLSYHVIPDSYPLWRPQFCGPKLAECVCTDGSDRTCHAGHGHHNRTLHCNYKDAKYSCAEDGVEPGPPPPLLTCPRKGQNMTCACADESGRDCTEQMKARLEHRDDAGRMPCALADAMVLCDGAFEPRMAFVPGLMPLRCHDVSTGNRWQEALGCACEGDDEACFAAGAVNCLPRRWVLEECPERSEVYNPFADAGDMAGAWRRRRK